jgi:hypothetical protein
MIITVTIALHGEWWMEWLIDSNFWLSDFYLALNLDFRKFVYSDLHHINENKTHLGPHIHHEMMVRFIFAVGRVELEINITKSPSYRSVIPRQPQLLLFCVRDNIAFCANPCAKDANSAPKRHPQWHSA